MYAEESQTDEEKRGDCHVIINLFDLNDNSPEIPFQNTSGVIHEGVDDGDTLTAVGSLRARVELTVVVQRERAGRGL